MTSGSAFRPLAVDAVIERIADAVSARAGIVRLAVDGPPCARPDDWAQALVGPLRTRGRPAVVLAAETFWRDASLRLEYGREDDESYEHWLDAAALRREVLDAVVSDGTYLPSLRNPATNRSTRQPRRIAEPGTVLLVSGGLLLGALPFDFAVHLSMSPAARARHTSPDDRWILPAFDRYDADVRPVDIADVVVRLDHPRRPAVREL